jgi:hypothetical protein
MPTRVIQEPPALRDLRHLANEIFPLLVPQQLPAAEQDFATHLHQVQANRALAAELAQTAWRRLRDVGPVTDGAINYFRALPDYQIEWLNYMSYNTKDPGNTRQVVGITRLENAYDAVVWLGLQLAEACTEQEYADVKSVCPALAVTVSNPQPAVKPVVPSAVGGARYVTEVWISSYLDAAFRCACDECGVVIVEKRPSYGFGSVVNDLHYYTISLPTSNDLFELGRFTVLHQQAFDGDQARKAA